MEKWLLTIEYDHKIYNDKRYQLNTTEKFIYNIFFSRATNLNVEFDRTMTTTNIKLVVKWVMITKFQSYSFGHVVLVMKYSSNLKIVSLKNLPPPPFPYKYECPQYLNLNTRGTISRPGAYSFKLKLRYEMKLFA